MNYLKIILKFFFAIYFFQLSSCGLKVVDNHGQIYEENVDFNELQVGKTTKKEIVEMLGTPSTTSVFDNGQNWIYISSEFRRFIFLDGSNTDQKVLILSFNQETLKNKEILSKNDINDIKHEETLTDSKNRKRSWIREFFTNLNPDPYGRRQK